MDVLATEEVIIKTDMLDSGPLADMVVAHDHGHGQHEEQQPQEQDEEQDEEQEDMDAPRIVLKDQGGTKAFLVQNTATMQGQQPTQIYIIQTSDGSFATLPVITTEGDEDEVMEGEEGKRSTSLVLQSASGPGNTTQVFETVSALEQLARGGEEEVEVYEEVVLPDGDQLVDVAEVEVGGNGEITLASSLPKTKTTSSTKSKKRSGGASGLKRQRLDVTLDTNNTMSGDVSVVRMRQSGSTGGQGGNDLVCPDCFKVFKSKRSLFGHRKEKHSGVTESHPCPECGKTFGRKSNLKAHRESLHYGKKFPCQFCERVFTNRSSRNQHMKKCHHAIKMAANNDLGAVRGNVIVLSDIVGNGDATTNHNVVIDTSPTTNNITNGDEGIPSTSDETSTTTAVVVEVSEPQTVVVSKPSVPDVKVELPTTVVVEEAMADDETDTS